ncbi:hypothetical protein HYR54_14850 [Candidatus Acetothermia bacterium]|nr:hypothetical protein [Candidatus Acetothermia bacterium]
MTTQTTGDVSVRTSPQNEVELDLQDTSQKATIRRHVFGRRSDGIEVQLDPELFPRREINKAIVASYKEAMLAGHSFPRVKTRPDGKVVDGTHRLMAAMAAGGPYLQQMLDEAEVVQGDLAEAIKLNIAHGLLIPLKERPALACRLFVMGKELKELAGIFKVQLRTVERWTKEEREAKREAEIKQVQQLAEDGHSVREIAHQLKIPKTTVHRRTGNDVSRKRRSVGTGTTAKSMATKEDSLEEALGSVGTKYLWIPEDQYHLTLEFNFEKLGALKIQLRRSPNDPKFDGPGSVIHLTRLLKTFEAVSERIKRMGDRWQGMLQQKEAAKK